MADEKIELPAFNLGIQDSEIYGNLTDAEGFLSETIPILTDPAKILKKEDISKILEAPLKKEEPDAIKLADDFLSLGEQEDEELGDNPSKDKTLLPVKKEGDDANLEGEEEGNQFEILSKELYTNGVFTTEDGENPILATTPEEFLQKFNEEKQKGATTWLENFLGRFGEDRRDMFDAVFVNGVDPKQYLSTFNEIENLENLSLTEEANQEKIVRTFYKRSGWTDEKIQNKIDKLKSYAELEDEATTVHPLLIASDKDKLKVLVEEKEQETQRQVSVDQEYKAGLTKFLQEKLKEKSINGFPLTDKEANKTFDYLYTKKWKTPSGELLTDFDKFVLESKKPENISHRTLIALLAQNNFDFSKIEKKAISKESSALFSALAQKTVKKSNKQQPTSNSWANL